ncbi:hypothetical protein [Escherichia coli]|uniref:hypothetical protein n=1 Tax=Escherichia coli TaxID=562 RepID=UPI003AB7DE8A
MNLQQRINKLPQLSSSSSGKDIDNIHSFIFNETSKDKIEDLLRKWVSGNQPCVFGKLASKKIKGLDFHLSIVNSPQLYNDDGHLFDFLRNERVRFNTQERGEVSAHLIYFILFHPQLAFARPSEELVDIQKYIVALHMPECYPIKEDVIYTESVQFRIKMGLRIYKAGVNVFTLLLIEDKKS